MIIDGKLCYNDGNEISLGDYVSVQIQDRWIPMEFNEFSLGQQIVIVNGQQQIHEQKAVCFKVVGVPEQGMLINPQEIAGLPMEYILEAEYENFKEEEVINGN